MATNLGTNSMEGKDRTEQINKIQLSLPAEKLQCDNETAVKDCDSNHRRWRRR